jgi:hypothetical protein
MKEIDRFVVSLFPLFFDISLLKMKYLENSLFKLQTVFTFELPVSRSSKLDPMSIGFVKLFLLYLLNYYGCTFYFSVYSGFS